VLYRFAKNVALAAETVTQDGKRLFSVFAACTVATTSTQPKPLVEPKSAVSAINIH
jgi:hypothetical protein